MTKGKVTLLILASVFIAMLVAARLSTDEDIANDRTSKCDSDSLKRAIANVAIKKGFANDADKVKDARGKRNGNTISCTAKIGDRTVSYQIREIPKDQLTTTPNVDGITVENVKFQ